MENIIIKSGPLQAITTTKGNPIDTETIVEGYACYSDTSAKLTIMSNDDIPLFFAIPGKVIGAMKIGKDEIKTKQLTANLRSSLVSLGLDASEMHCIIGPCLTFSHMPVERKVIEKLLDEGFMLAAKRTDGVDFLDLPDFVLTELRHLGVKMENIVIGDYDTYENPEMLYSRLRGDKEMNATTAYLG